MWTIAEKLRHLVETKTAIKNAITAKGVSVSDHDTFRSYATKIEAIQGNEDNIEIPISTDLNKIYFRVDYEAEDTLNIMMSGGDQYWNISMMYYGTDFWMNPLPPCQPENNVSLTLDIYDTGFKKQALIELASTSRNCNYTISTSNPNIKITFLSKDYLLTCTRSRN